MSKGMAKTPGGNVAVNIYHGDLVVRSLISWITPFNWTFADRGIMEMVNANPDFDALLGIFEKALVSRVKRRLLIRSVRFCRSA
jgi:hypothetical protein